MEVERVLRDMWQETKTPLMVYATDDALKEAPEPLSGPLERFVKADNKSFLQELKQEQSQGEKSFTPLEVVSPSKRKHRSDSMDSMNSNRASLGSIDMEDRANPFADQFDNAGPNLLEGEMQERQVGRLGGSTGGGDRPFGLMALQQPGHKAVETSVVTEEVGSSAPNRNGAPTPSTSTLTDGFSRTLTPDAEATRSPEMQERSRVPAFMATPSNEGGKPRTVDTMEMEVPEFHE